MEESFPVTNKCFDNRFQFIQLQDPSFPGINRRLEDGLKQLESFGLDKKLQK